MVIFYDHDEPGRKGANKLAQALGSRGAIAEVPRPESGETPKGWDISDFLNASDPKKAIAAISTAAADAKPYTPPPSDNPLRQRLITNDELMARAADYTDWLVDQILTTDELFLLAAPPRKGKTLLSLTLTKAVATGGKFLGRPVSQGAVLYIRCEDSETKTKERELKQGWAEGLPVYWLDKFKLSELEHLRELVEELQVRLVVFDTLSRIRDNSISESSAEMSQLLEPIQDMCKSLRVCGLLVHHTGKVNLQNAGDIDVFDTIRGSSAIRATCRGTLILASDDRCYRLAVENGWGKLDLEILLDANSLNWKLLGNWQGPDVDMNQADRVLAYLTKVGSATIEQIAEETNMPKASLYVVLRRLQSDEMVKKRGERRSAVYIRSAIEQIEHVQNMFNSSNPDREKITSLSNKSVGGGDPPSKPGSEGQTGIQHVTQITTQIPVLEPAHMGDMFNNSRNACPVRDSELNMNLTTIEQGDPDHTKPGSEGADLVGKKVLYTGSKSTLTRVCGRKRLTVKSVSNKVAVIEHDQWLVTQSIPVSDLKLVKERKS
ncbi:MAG: AAA family ATPase [Cyanobacteria bacterium J06648_16]